MERERKESEVITRYDPIQRDMTITDLAGRPYKGEFNQELISFPTRVVLEIDSRCNFRCQYCSEGKNPAKYTIPKERLFNLIDELEDMQVHELTIRGGEATMHPDYDEIWEYAASKEFLSANILTNGFAFDNEKIARTLENPRSKIVVSLDGFPEINSLYRHPLQFQKVLDWLEPALQDRPDQVTLLSVIYRQNYDSIPQFARFMAEKGLRFYHLSPLKRLGRSEIADENFASYYEINLLQRTLEAIQEEHPEFEPTISCISLEKYHDNKTDHIPVPLFNEMHFGTGVKITPEGNIMANRGIMFTDRFKDRYVETACLRELGSIYEERSFKGIWEESLGLRIEQGRIANKHYGYYLGWLKDLRT